MRLKGKSSDQLAKETLEALAKRADDNVNELAAWGDRKATHTAAKEVIEAVSYLAARLGVIYPKEAVKHSEHHYNSISEGKA